MLINSVLYLSNTKSSLIDPLQQILNTYPGQSNTEEKLLRTLILQHSNLHNFVLVYLHPLLRPLSGMHQMRATQERKAAASVAPMRSEGERKRVKLLKSK
jgi:hypothetical protein